MEKLGKAERMFQGIGEKSAYPGQQNEGWNPEAAVPGSPGGGAAAGDLGPWGRREEGS